MRTTLGWILITLLLIAVPAAAQEGQSTTDGWKAPSLEELADLPILAWIVAFVTAEEEQKDEPATVSPTTPLGETTQLDGGTVTEARGGPEPWG